MDQISWIWRISRMLHRIWCFPNNDENPDEVKNGRKVNCPSDILVKRWLSLRFLPRHIPPQSKYSLLLREFVNLPGESHDQAVGIQRVWKLWEMQFRCSKTCRLLVDAVHILALPQQAKNSLFPGGSHDHAFGKLGAVLYHITNCIS